jgi:Na+/pantothenate symporter
MDLNPYFIGAAFMVFVAVAWIVVSEYLWALAFFGGALAMYFLGAGRDSDEDDRDAR